MKSGGVAGVPPEDGVVVVPFPLPFPFPLPPFAVPFPVPFFGGAGLYFGFAFVFDAREGVILEGVSFGSDFLVLAMAGTRRLELGATRLGGLLHRQAVNKEYTC